MSTKPLSPPLIIAHTQIRRDPVGRYCLNDLHQASGGAKRHQPANWLRTDQAQALVAELQKPSKNEEGLLRYEEAPLEVVNDGFANGTYAVKELVYAYAMWISPRFHLEVIRAYDALVNSRSLGEATLPAYRATHALRARLVAMLGRAGSAAERQALHDQLAQLSQDLGLPCPPLAAFEPPNPHAATLARFWDAFQRLDDSGARLNHSRNPGLLALNLAEVIQAAAAADLPLPARPGLLPALRHSEQPRFLGAKAVNSPLSRKTVKCWVFERGSDVT